MTPDKQINEFEPFAWCIEFGKPTTVAFIRNKGQHDLAYAEQRAAALHGVLIPLFIERRKP